MDNQHRQIKGYRDLSQAEIDLMNEVKSEGQDLQHLVDKVDAHLRRQRATGSAQQGDSGSGAELQRMDQAQPERWMAIARTHLQEGLMALTRAVAQPTHF